MVRGTKEGLVVVLIVVEVEEERFEKGLRDLFF